LPRTPPPPTVTPVDSPSSTSQPVDLSQLPPEHPSQLQHQLSLLPLLLPQLSPSPLPLPPPLDLLLLQELLVSLLALLLPVLLLLPVPLALPLVTASSTELVWPAAPSWEPEALLSEPEPVVPSSLPLLEVPLSEPTVL